MPVPMVMPIACRAPRAAPHPPLAEHGAVGVVVERGRQAERGRGSIARSGKFTQPRFGVSSTMPLLRVERARARRRPTPRNSAPGTSRRVCVDGALRPAPTSRSTTASAPASGAGRLARERRAAREPSSATLPTTRLVPPMSMPRTYRTRCASAVDEMAATAARHRRRPTAPACSGDGPAGRPAGPCGSRDGSASPACSTTTSPRAERPEAEGGHRRPEDAPRPACPPPSPGAAAPSRW